MIFYEGNIYDASNLKRFHNRAISTYGRMVNSYQTVARTIADIGLFEVVGEINGSTIKLDATASFKSWVDQDEKLISL